MRTLLIIFSLISFSSLGQSLMFFSNPPPRPYSAFNDAAAWWRADTYSGSAGSFVFTDLSGNSHPMGQAAGTLTAGTGVNSQAKFTGNSSAYLTSNLAVQSWPLTVITIAVRGNNEMVGFFGHVGASGFNTFWYGYEASNVNRIYNTNSSSNTTAEAGTIACYTARIGYGSRVSMVNGIIQATMTPASIARTAAVATTLGTQYRGFNMDWYETIVWNRTLTLADLDEVHAYINARYGMSIPLWSSYSEAPTIVKAGQSNSSGRGDRGASDVNVPSPYNGVLTGCNVWYGTPAAGVGTAFNTLSIAANNHMLGDDGLASSYIGDEETMCKDYIDDHGGSVYLVKFAQGGTFLAYDAGGNYWAAADETEAQQSSRKLYRILMQNWWQSLRIQQGNSLRPVIKGIDWYQGEQDAVTQVNADAYQTNLTSFINTARPELGFTAENSPFYIVRIHADIDGAQHPYKATVRTAQDNVAAALTNCFLVSVDGYTLRDAAHINVAGQLALGSFLATQF
jgi:hypothetical protein